MTPQAAGLSARIVDFAKSELFDRTYREGMALVDEAAAYLDGPGRSAAKRLSRTQALAYAGKSMRLTTRLMQVASWLLVQRAVRDGRMELAEAASDKYRFTERQAEVAARGGESLPQTLTMLAARADALHERIRRLDQDLYGGDAAANGVGDQLARIEAAFAGKANSE
jgi:regulator of CtrA degradation